MTDEWHPTATAAPQTPTEDEDEEEEVSVVSVAVVGSGAGDAPTCRICLADEDRDDLIAPCDCRGSTEYVHRRCLRRWVHLSGKRRCMICAAPYTFAPRDPSTGMVPGANALTTTYSLLSNTTGGGRAALRVTRGDVWTMAIVFVVGQCTVVISSVVLLSMLSKRDRDWLCNNLFPYNGDSSQYVVAYSAICDVLTVMMTALIGYVIFAPPRTCPVSVAALPVWREHTVHGLYHGRCAVLALSASVFFALLGLYFLQFVSIVCTGWLAHVADVQRRGTMRVWARERLVAHTVVVGRGIDDDNGGEDDSGNGDDDDEQDGMTGAVVVPC